MHRNYRRKDPQNPVCYYFWAPSVGQRREYLRLYSKQRRQQERQARAHDEWDGLPSRYPRTFLYWYW